MGPGRVQGLGLSWAPLRWEVAWREVAPMRVSSRRAGFVSVRSAQHLLQHRNLPESGNQSRLSCLQDQTVTRNPNGCVHNVLAVSCWRFFCAKLDHAPFGRPDPESEVIIVTRPISPLTGGLRRKRCFETRPMLDRPTSALVRGRHPRGRMPRTGLRLPRAKAAGQGGPAASAAPSAGPT